MALLTRVEIALENGALLYSVEEPDSLSVLEIPYFVEEIPIRRLVIGTAFIIPPTDQSSGGHYCVKDIKTFIGDASGNSPGTDGIRIELHLIYIVEPVVFH